MLSGNCRIAQHDVRVRRRADDVLAVANAKIFAFLFAGQRDKPSPHGRLALIGHHYSFPPAEMRKSSPFWSPVHPTNHPTTGGLRLSVSSTVFRPAKGAACGASLGASASKRVFTGGGDRKSVV